MARLRPVPQKAERKQISQTIVITQATWLSRLPQITPLFPPSGYTWPGTKTVKSHLVAMHLHACPAEDPTFSGSGLKLTLPHQVISHSVHSLGCKWRPLLKGSPIPRNLPSSDSHVFWIFAPSSFWRFTHLRFPTIRKHHPANLILKLACCSLV